MGVTGRAEPRRRPAVRLEVTAGLGTIVLDLPPVNALSRAAQHGLHRAAIEAADRDDVGAVVIRGEGPVFCAGADIKEMAGMSHAEMAEHAPRLQAAFRAVAEIGKPVVAAIEGPALGGGCELALAADRRICSANTTIGLPEIRLGVIPAAGGTQRLTRLVGTALAKQMIFTGRALDADSALAAGLVDSVVGDGATRRAAEAWARQFLRGPAAALRAAKIAIDIGREQDLPTALNLETSLFADLFATADRDIGMDHFVHHRTGPPPFGTSRARARPA